MIAGFRLLLFDQEYGIPIDLLGFPDCLTPERVDIGRRPELLWAYDIRKVPTLMLLRDDVECWRQTDCHPREELRRELFWQLDLPAIDPRWLAWGDGTVAKMARVIDEERRFEDLPILADALEDAGCDNAEILEHCRQGEPHTRGCWVVDLLLGKE